MLLFSDRKVDRLCVSGRCRELIYGVCKIHRVVEFDRRLPYSRRCEALYMLGVEHEDLDDRLLHQRNKVVKPS